MITFLQKAIWPKNTYATENDPARATYFQQDGGQIQPIANLPHVNQQTDEEPLEMPVINFGEKTNTQETDDDVLGMPSVFDN